MIKANQGSKRNDRKIYSSIYGEFRTSVVFQKNLPATSAHFSLCLSKYVRFKNEDLTVRYCPEGIRMRGSPNKDPSDPVEDHF
jgi:hypothetical protein